MKDITKLKKKRGQKAVRKGNGSGLTMLIAGRSVKTLKKLSLLIDSEKPNIILIPRDTGLKGFIYIDNHVPVDPKFGRGFKDLGWLVHGIDTRGELEDADTNSFELIDALWEAVKSVLEREE